MELEAVLDELYALAPDAFLPRRAELAAQARSEGDRDLANEIRQLRKPSVAAWAVNRMAQTRPTDVATLSDLASRLRSAQQSLDGAQLQQLGRERSRLVDILVKATTEAAREGGATLSAAATRDAADTFVAALASPDATAAVVSGRLTRTLTYAGFGDVDLTEATARPLRAVPDTMSSAESEQASGSEPPTPDPEVAKAEARLKTAVAAATEAAQKRSVIAAELELAENRVAQLSRELARARAHRMPRRTSWAAPRWLTSGPKQRSPTLGSRWTRFAPPRRPRVEPNGCQNGRVATSRLHWRNPPSPSSRRSRFHG